MTENIKILGLFLIIFIGFPLEFSQIGKHYDYALDRENHPADCSSFFEEGERYDFSTVVWALGDNCHQSINGGIPTGYYIYTTHITTKDQSPSVLKIHFEKIAGSQNLRNNNVELLEDSISVVITTPDGKPISAKNSNFNSVGKDSWMFTQQYSQELPEELIENITLELIVNGERIKVSKTYPIELQVHYNLWDQLMGV